jgi:hypothetical protein
MKRRTNTVKTLVAMLVMTFALVMTGTVSQAATKSDKLTLYVGEKAAYSYIGVGTLKSVKSSKSKVVAAKKYKGGSYMEAKKAGKATVTVKGSRGTWKHNITVKKLNYDLTYSLASNGEDLLVSLTNKTSDWFDDFYVTFTFYDEQGNELITRTKYLYYVGPKQTALGKISGFNYYDNIDYSKTTYSIETSRSYNYKYTNYEKKVNVTENVTTSGSSRYLNLTEKFKKKYKGSGTVYIAYKIEFFDENGQLLSVRDDWSLLAKSIQSNTTEVLFPSDAVSYKLTKRVVEKKYKK